MARQPSEHSHERSLRIVDDGPKDKVRLYNTPCAHYLDMIKKALHHLKHFEVGSSRIRALGEECPSFQLEMCDGPPFNKRLQFLFGLFQDRYPKWLKGLAADVALGRSGMCNRNVHSDRDRFWTIRIAILSVRSFTKSDSRCRRTSTQISLDMSVDKWGVSKQRSYLH